jgi:hypothetical protein
MRLQPGRTVRKRRSTDGLANCASHYSVVPVIAQSRFLGLFAGGEREVVETQDGAVSSESYRNIGIIAH